MVGAPVVALQVKVRDGGGMPGTLGEPGPRTSPSTKAEQPRRRSGLLIISATSALFPSLPELLPLFFPTTQSARQQRPAGVPSSSAFARWPPTVAARFELHLLKRDIYIYIYKIEFDQVDGFCMSFAKRKITGLGCSFVCGKCLLLRSTVPSFVF